MSDELPEGWAALKLSDAGTWCSGGTPSRKMPGYFGGAIPWIKSGDLRDGLITHAEETITQSGLENSSAKLLPKGTVSIAMYGATIGRVGLFGLDAATNQACANCQVDDRLVDRKLLLLYLLSQRDGFVAVGQGGAQPNISATILKDWPFPLAPLPEQRRIVDKVEALLEQVNRAKERLDRVPLILKRFRQAVLAAACSGELTREWRADHPDAVAPRLPEAVHEGRRGRRGANLSGEGALLIDEELPELPVAWNYARLDRLTEPDTVITYGIVLPGAEIAGGVPYVRGQDVEDGWLRTDALRHTTKEIASKHDRSSLRAGDVLLCVIRNLRVAVVPDGLDGSNITQGMVRIRTSPAVVLRDFVASYLMSPLAQGWMKRRYFGMDMPRINVEDARAVPVALPPLGEQAEIVRQVKKLFALANAIERRVVAASSRADRLPQAILSKAFSGELVPTEAELARAECRTCETAEELLARVRRERSQGAPAGRQRSPRTVPSHHGSRHT